MITLNIISNTDKYKSRWIILTLLFSLTTTAYLARMDISVALPFIAKEYSWTKAQEGKLGGVLLGIFLVSYGFSNVFFSPLIDVIGSKKGLIMAILIWSISTSLGAVFGHIYQLFIISRIFLGLGQGVLFPTASKLTQGWFPSRERAKANAFHQSGNYFANILAPLLLVSIIIITSWRVMFHLVAIVGFILIIPVWLYLEDPAVFSWDTNIKAVKVKTFSRLKKEIKSELKKHELWILIVAFALGVTVWWVITLWLPTYLIEEQGFNTKEMSVGAAIPYIGGIIGILSGSWIGDKVGKRTLIIATSLLINALFILTIPLFHSKPGVILILTLIIFSRGISPPNVYTLLQSKVSPAAISSITGLLNGISNGCGALGTVAMGMMFAFTGSYKLGFISMAVILFIEAGLFLLLWKTKRY